MPTSRPVPSHPPIVPQVVAGPAVPADSDTALARRLDAVIDAAVSGDRLVGTVVVVARHGQIVYRRAAGLADREAAKPMQQDTIFRLASLSKSVVSVAAMRLVELGQLDLNASVTDWLPDFRPRLANGETPTITIRHLLTHTAGLTYGFREPPNSPYHQFVTSDGMDHSGVSLEDNLRRIASAPLTSPPGRVWQYSIATDVLGAVLQKAGGDTLPAVVQQLVGDPLEWRDTGFHVTETDRLAVPYADAAPSPVRMRGHTTLPHALGGAVHFNPDRALDPTAYPSGGAGMVGTADEFCALLESLRVGRERGASVLLGDTIRQMTSPQIGLRSASDGPGWGFGFGWAVLIDPELAATPQSLGTFHWNGAYGNSWFVDPIKELSVVALTNTTFEGMSGAFTTDLRDAVYRVG